MIKALIWLEWQRQRNTILWTAAGIMALWFAAWLIPKLLFLTRDGRENIKELCWIGAYVLPYGYLIAYCNIFTREFQTKTICYLQGLPVTPTQIYWTKYAFMLVITVGLAAINLGNMLCQYFSSISEESSRIFDMLMTNMFTFLLMSGGILFAVIINQTNAKSARTVWGLGLLFFGATTFIMGLALLSWSGGLIFFNSTPLLFDITIFVLSLICLFDGWYLWVYWVSRGLTLNKILYKQAGMLVLAALVVYGAVGGFALFQWHSAQREAAALNIPVAETFVSEAQNAAPLLKEFSWRWTKVVGEIPGGEKGNFPVCPKFSGAQWQKVLKAMAAPEAQNAGDWLERALSCQQCHFTVVVWERMEIMDSANNYLTCRNWITRYQGDEVGFFKAVQDRIRLYELAYKAGNTASEYIYLMNAYRFAIDLGPDSLTAAGQYRQLIETSGNYDLWTYEFDCNPFKDYVAMIMPLRVYLAPYRMLNDAAMLQEKIEALKLARGAECYPEVAAVAEKITLSRSRGQGYGNNRVRQYYQRKTQLIGYKLALALRIYRIEHGGFPEKLEALAPSILPKIPLDPLRGKPFIYHRNGDGFAIDSDKTDPQLATYPFHLEYQPWDIKTASTK